MEGPRKGTKTKENSNVGFTYLLFYVFFMSLCANRQECFKELGLKENEMREGEEWIKRGELGRSRKMSNEVLIDLPPIRHR